MVRGLSFQSTYRCERSGACCSSNWPIPVEADRLARIQAAVASGALGRPHTPSGAWLRRPPDAPAGALPLLGVEDGRCVFFDTTGGHGCAIQRSLGHDALPLACRQFPRVSTHDPRGTSVVLSCYCPTAAALLDRPGPVAIVESPGAFPERGEYVGLDAREAWPPILRPGVLMDWPSWWTFERRAVDLIANVSASADEAMARLTAVVERVRSWVPGANPLEAHVDAAFDEAEREGHARATLDAGAIRARVAALHSAIPGKWRIASTPETPVVEPPIRQLRFLTCHAFGNWAVHLGHDLRAWLDSVAAAQALLAAGFGVREADLRLRHLMPAAGLRDGPS